MIKNIKKYLTLLFILLFLFNIEISAANTTYTIRNGDTLNSIANYYNIKVNDILIQNNIKNPDLIQIGAKIKIPVSMVKYKIKKGDNLSDLADRYNTSCEQIIKVNKIKNPDKIYPGQTINIPKTTKKSEKKEYAVLARSRRPSFIWPVQGNISSKYGWRIHPVFKKRKFHTGIDISVPVGTPVFAAESGTVTYSGWSSGYGYLIIIDHNNQYKSYYAHNIKLFVEKGKKIKKGKIIALSGNTGLSTGPHLHFEIRKNNNSEDPLKHLNLEYIRKKYNV
ncbi:MAG: peptidoglycan DD-metalloendopeptidase family protein [bacterium]